MKKLNTLCEVIHSKVVVVDHSYPPNVYVNLVGNTPTLESLSDKWYNQPFMHGYTPPDDRSMIYDAKGHIIAKLVDYECADYPTHRCIKKMRPKMIEFMSILRTVVKQHASKFRIVPIADRFQIIDCTFLNEQAFIDFKKALDYGMEFDEDYGVVTANISVSGRLVFGGVATLLLATIKWTIDS